MVKALKSFLVTFARAADEQHMPAMEAIWCSEDRHAAFNQVMNGNKLHLPTVKTWSRAQYQLGLNMGVNGTPAIYNAERP